MALGREECGERPNRAKDASRARVNGAGNRAEMVLYST
jgi:hypothetical protein